MKVEANLIEAFKPIEVKITIGSDLELKCLIDMARFNQSIPDLVNEGGDEGKIIIENFLNTLRHHLTKY
jgi:hypothetical protein